MTITPEPARGRSRSGDAKDGCGRTGAVLLGCFPVLRAGQQGAVDATPRGVANREYGGGRRRLAGVDHHALIGLQTGLLGEGGLGRHPHTEEHGVKGARLVLARDPDLDAGRGVRERLDAGGDDGDPALGVQSVQPGGDVTADRVGQRRRDRVDQGDFAAEAKRGRRGLRPDQTGADDQQPGTGQHRLAQSIGILGGAQDVDPRAVRARNRRAGRMAAGGQHDAIGGKQLSVGQFDGPMSGAEGGHGCQVAQPHRVVVVPTLRLQGDLLKVLLPGEIVLAQRRAVVGELTGVDKRDLAQETARAERRLQC